ncbi:MAG: exodeoxyribonuclease V subunit gamma, partial [Actinomycetota bacterium]
MSLSIVASPSLAELTGQVALRLGGPRPDPFAPDWVVVPSAGVREYLVEHLPRSGGACPVLANVNFVYPGRFNTLALGVEHPDDDPWSVERLRWTILQLLEEDAAGDRSIGAPRFAESQRRFAYATKVAVLFERYGVQRPELLVEWHRAEPDGASGHWQRALWRRVRERIGTESPAERIVARASLGSAAGSGRRFTLVGLDLFSPGKVAILEQLANADDIAVFTIQPSA